MEQTAGPLPTDDVSHVVYLGEEAAPLFPLAEHCELPSISADVVSAILLQLPKFIYIANDNLMSMFVEPVNNNS
jgi:hypothetical protein